ncbi:c-type cytochrome [Tsuneonella sp. HG222]
MTDRLNTIFGWILFSGIVALGLNSLFSHILRADDHHMPENPGFVIEAPEEGEGGGAGPDLGTLLAAADPAAGEKVFAKCVSCHTINSGGATGIGPNLFGIVGQPIGKHAPGFAYSSDLAGHGGNWDYANLDHWLASPKAFASGTKMSFAGLSKPEDRANVIAYLKANGGGPDYPAPAAPEAAPAEDDPAAAAGDAAATPEAEGAAAAGAVAADQPADTEATGATAN